jgi:tryptophanyl-tRNA synthetase
MQQQGRVFSGIQPTSGVHLGNYLGAIRNWVALQDRYDCVYCIVDLHALTVLHDRAAMLANTREMAAALLASGIDPARSILFVQSNVPAHAQLGWVFNCVTPMGWLSRMTQFKEKAGKDKENAAVGLFDYPVLQAADILAYRATHVPWARTRSSTSNSRATSRDRSTAASASTTSPCPSR